MIDWVKTFFENTQNVAVWGAITGSIGTVTGALSLWLRFRQQKRDQAKLKCEVSFDHDFTNGSPSKRYKIVVRSVGRRPVTVDYVKYFMAPTDLPQRLQRWYKWYRNEWIIKDDIRTPTTLTEGTKTDVPIDTNRRDLKHIYKVNVVDQTGRAWKVRWPSRRKIKLMTHYKELVRTEDENPRKKYTLVGYEFQDTYTIIIYWNPEDGKKSSMRGRHFTYKSRKQYEEKLTELTDRKIPAFMEGGEPDFEPPTKT